eukprot:6187475-Pleurochrysis_carterae.AAC.5
MPTATLMTDTNWRVIPRRPITVLGRSNPCLNIVVRRLNLLSSASSWRCRADSADAAGSSFAAILLDDSIYYLRHHYGEIPTDLSLHRHFT